MDEVADGPAPSLCRATPVARHASAEAHCASLGDAACASSVCVGRTSCPSLPLRIASPHLGPWIAEAGRDDLVLAVPFADYVRISGEPGVEVRAPDRWGTFVVQRRDLRGRALFSFRPTHPRSDLGGMARAPSGEVVVTWEEAFGSGLGPEGSEGATRWVVRGARLGPDGSVRASWTEPRLRARLVADASRVYGLTSSPTGELSVVATDHDGAVRWTTPISTADRQARVALWEGRLVVVHALMVGGVQGARLTFLDPETGHELSRHEHGGRDDVVLGPGMYFQTEWSAIVARRADGTELWRRELPFALTELRWHGDRLTATGLPRCPPDRPDLRAIICVQAAPRILVLDRDGRELRFGPGAGAVMRIGGELVVAETSGSVSEVELRPLSAERLCADCMGRRFRTEAEWRADFAQ